LSRRWPPAARRRCVVSVGYLEHEEHVHARVVVALALGLGRVDGLWSRERIEEGGMEDGGWRRVEGGSCRRVTGIRTMMSAWGVSTSRHRNHCERSS
jgi:hypothetical protein